MAAEYVWSIRTDIHVLDHDGNLTDASVLATMAALQHFRRPEVTVIQHGADGTTSESAGDSEVKIHHSDDLEPKPLPLHHVPLTVTFGLMREPNTEGSARTVLDPSAREEAVMDGRITLSLNAHRELCAIHKLGGAPVKPGQIVQLAHIASERVVETLKWLTDQLERADAQAQLERAARLRGSDFVDSVADKAAAEAPGPTSQVPDGSEEVAHLDYADLHVTFKTRDRQEKASKEADASNPEKQKLLEAISQAAAPDTGHETSSAKRQRLDRLSAADLAEMDQVAAAMVKGDKPS